MKTTNEKIEYLKNLVFEMDNNACFIERERFLNTLDPNLYCEESPEFFAKVLSGLLASVSVPVDENDIFVGRVLEGVTNEYEQIPCKILAATGHMSPNYSKLLKLGFRGILQEIKSNAERLGDEKSQIFYQNAQIVVAAIHFYAKRYAEAARKKGLIEAANALEKVPYEPAYDFYSALQGMWIVHLIASCYIGARDYAFGKFDEIMYPYYTAALKEGKTEDELIDLMAGFFLKTNEICGRTSWNYHKKPILCNSSKQYVNIGGEHPNKLSFAILKAAEKVNMAQPQIIVLLDPGADTQFTDAVFSTLSVLTDKMNVYSYPSIKRFLLGKGIPEEIAKDFTYSACCTFDLNHRNFRQEYFMPSMQMFCEVLKMKIFCSVQEILDLYSVAISDHLRTHFEAVQQNWSFRKNRKFFALDALLIGDCTKKCRYPMKGGLTYHVYNVFFSGIATIADSLAAIDHVVFQEKKLSYAEYMDIVEHNFEGHEDLRLYVQSLPKYGNDTDVDQYVTRVADTFLSVVEQIELLPNRYAIPGFYSLDKDNRWGKDIPATPDGRLAGEGFSENQSPVYGADKNGITALLNSVSKIPLQRTATGGFNLTFSRAVEPEILKGLITTFFQNGGLHVGITVLKREELEEAMVNPDKYKSLTVRLYGFSEYFINLPDWQQKAVLNRTAY